MPTPTARLRAWTTSKWQSIDDITARIDRGEIDQALGSLVYTSHDMSDAEGWTEVGTAEVCVTFFPRAEVVAKEIDSLKQQLQKTRAENHLRENAILDRISKLQAITYVPEAA